MKRDQSAPTPSGLDASRALFIQELKINHEELNRLLTDTSMTNSSESIRKILHKIKGAAGFFGMKSLDEAVRSVQKNLEEVGAVGVFEDRDKLRQCISPVLSQILAECSLKN